MKRKEFCAPHGIERLPLRGLRAAATRGETNTCPLFSWLTAALS